MIETARKSRNPAWDAGDWTRISEWMRDSSDRLVATLGLSPDMDVLDIGCGDGTTAMAEARAGANVLCVSIASTGVAAAEQQAREAGLTNIRFVEADPGNLEGIADSRFDLVLSIFGAMFAPRPEDVAREMVRVARPGGRIVMANAIPGDPTLISQLLKIALAYLPTPPDFVSPLDWGDEGLVRERFERAGIAPGDIRFEHSTWHFLGAGPVSELFATFVDYCVPTRAAVEAADHDGRSTDLQRDLRALFEAQNQGADDATDVPATYLKVTVTKR